MKSTQNHTFSQIPKIEIPRSMFDRSHGYKTTFNSGYLVPFFVDEVLPGDTFKARATLFARLATPIFPIMDNLFLETFYFYVPNRLLWSHWQNFCGEKASPEDTTSYLMPYVAPDPDAAVVGSLWDYFGLPLAMTNDSNCRISALPFRAYNLIYNEWFRDENLIDPRPKNVGDGPDSMSDYILLKRCKRHDYFTSALPWPQKGPGVMLPLGSQAPVYGNGHALGLSDGSGSYGAFALPGLTVNAMAGSTDAYGVTNGTSITTGDGFQTSKALGVTGPGSSSGLYADLSSATAATINSLRQAFQLQRMYERDARGGSRYTELLRSHFGVISPDARLQRPEYLGGSSSRVIVNPVQQTGATVAGVSPQGNLAAFGLATDSNGGFTKSFTEHGIIIGIVNVRADLTYDRGVNRMWTRRTRFDHYWPALSHLGEQEVYNREIYYVNGDTGIFGYQERFAEYRYYPSQLTGLMRTNASLTLDAWHLAQKFTSLPTLNQSFIEENPPVARVIAVTSQPEFIMDSFIELKCARPMPVYSVPGLIDHF